MIPAHIDAFIRTTVRSIWGLEALLLLRASGDQEWTAEGLSAALRGAVPMAQGILDIFVRANVMRREDSGAYRYSPQGDVGAIVDELAKINDTYPLTVAKAILLAPNGKVQTFVDAFKFKQDFGDGKA